MKKARQITGFISDGDEVFSILDLQNPRDSILLDQLVVGLQHVGDPGIDLAYQPLLHELLLLSDKFF